MKASRTIRSSNRANRSVAWRTTLLLIALGAVLMALFFSARLLLSPANGQSFEQANPSPSLSSPHVAHLWRAYHAPYRSVP
jgi:hypothetical protein